MPYDEQSCDQEFCARKAIKNGEQETQKPNDFALPARPKISAFLASATCRVAQNSGILRQCCGTPAMARKNAKLPAACPRGPAL
jgi:hypothetical protein